MPLKTLDAPCWRLTCPDGADYDEGDGARHFDSDAKARSYATDYLLIDDPATVPAPRQWDRPCLLSFCDSCGDEFDDGIWVHTHFADEKTAHEEVGLYDDYRVEVDADGTKMFCPKCPAVLDEDDD